MLVRGSYFRENMLQGNLSISDEQVATPLATGPSPSNIKTADPIQADLYFESAAGYGRWRILCSGPCLRDLARDGAQSNPVLKRLEYVPVTSCRRTPKNIHILTGNFRQGVFPELTKSG